MRCASFSLLLTLALPSSGAAQETSHHAWGAPLSDRGPSVLSLSPCDFPCFATVRFDNTLVANDGGTLTHEATLVLNGVGIAVVVQQGDERIPDVLRVSPPLGYVAEPSEVVVHDDASGTVQVVLIPIG